MDKIPHNVPAEEQEENKVSRLAFWLNAVMIFCALVSVAELVAVSGWTLKAIHVDILGALSIGTVIAFFVQEVFRLFCLRKSVFAHLKKFWFESVLVLLVPVVFFSSLAIGWKFSQEFMQSYFAVLHAIIALVVGLRAVRSRHMLAAGTALTPGRVFILSFALLILAGTLMLLTPNATKSGISFIDALFFATSAVCVTGLVPVPSLPETLTQFGQCILLALVQLGGLGVMSITYFFAYFFAGGLSLKNRFAFRDLFSEDNISQIGLVLGVMIGFTLSVEIVGAAWIYLSYAADAPGVSDPIFFSVFHSVMAFCNAGFSTLPNGLATGEIPTQYGFVGGIISLTVIGGLSFPVFKNFWLVAVDRVRRGLLRSRASVPVRLTAHTKLVLVTTAALFVGGIIFLYLTGVHEQGGTFLRAVFLSASSRTAGFDIGDTGGLATGTLLVVMVLMFIGGAPFSTAGGIKVTTFAVAFLSLRQMLFGKRDLEVFGRRLDSDVAKEALAIVLLASAFLALVAIALCTMHPEQPASFMLFEAVSAVATVGLTCDITPKLCLGAKCVLVVAMFVGRIGILLFLTSFVSRRASTGARLPETTIVLT